MVTALKFNERKNINLDLEVIKQCKETHNLPL